MPIRRRKTKPQVGIKVRGPIQNVKQSVKVIIQAPAKPVRRRRATTGAKKGDIFSNLMRAPEYTTFRDLTPVSASTGYVPTQPQQPFRTDLNQLRIEDQDRIGSVSGGLSVAPQGLLPGPKPEDKKDPYAYQDVTEDVEKMEKEKENRKIGLEKRKETIKKKKIRNEAFEKVLKADKLRQLPLMKSAFGAFQDNVIRRLEEEDDADKAYFTLSPPPEEKKTPLKKKKGLYITTDEALRKMKSISKKADK